jgi:hypothetical protein
MIFYYLATHFYQWPPKYLDRVRIPDPDESLFNRPLGSGYVIQHYEPGSGSERNIYGSTTLQRGGR